MVQFFRPEKMINVFLFEDEYQDDNSALHNIHICAFLTFVKIHECKWFARAHSDSITHDQSNYYKSIWFSNIISTIAPKLVKAY